MVWVDNDIERDKQEGKWLRRAREQRGFAAGDPSQTHAPADD
jgi:hypothetical protein